MNILKGILHRFNKKTNEYDTIHPETEVSQITDFNQGIVNTLASTVLGKLVTELSSDSLIYKIVAKVLEVSGVRYSFGETGYIVLGKFFGNFCIQWVSKDVVGNGQIYLPLDATIYTMVTQHYGVSAQYNGLNYPNITFSSTGTHRVGLIAITKLN